jgi:hypothetical protein
MNRHRALRHPDLVEGCYACKLSTINIAPSVAATTAGGAEAATVSAREARWSRDMPAYARLRADGIQPKGIDGSARLEATATERVEVEMGRVFGPRHKAKVREGVALSAELGLT